MYRVYIILNTVNNKCYVGQTSEYYLSSRWSSRYLGGNPHFNAAVKKYGWQAFSIETLNICSSQEEMNNFERLWILCLRSYDRRYGYNMRMGGEAGGRLTPDACAKLSKLYRGVKRSPEFGKKISNANKGRKFTEEHCSNLKLVQQRLKTDSEHIKKVAKVFQNTHLREKRVEIMRTLWRTNPTIAITNGFVNKRLSKVLPIPNGWRRGITRKKARPSIWITNEIADLRIEEKYAIPSGWRLGRKHHSEERRKKNSISHLGKTPWNKGRRIEAA